MCPSFVRTVLHKAQQHSTTTLLCMMMSSILLRHQARRALTSYARREVSKRPACNYLASRNFSAEPAAAEEKPLIPGIGLGKTSTGLVSDAIFYCGWVVSCIVIGIYIIVCYWQCVGNRFYDHMMHQASIVCKTKRHSFSISCNIIVW